MGNEDIEEINNYEDLELEVIEKLSWLEEMELRKIYQEDCQLGTVPASGGKRVLLKMILKFLTSEVTTFEDKGLSFFLKIKTSITDLEEAYLETRERKSLGAVPVKTPEVESPVSVRSSTPSRRASEIEPVERPVIQHPNFEYPVHRELPVNMTSQKLESLLRKELKIQGTVGKPGQKDKLSFSSLIFQIDSAERKGYLEDDIISAVIKSVSPDLDLRSYLEGKSGMSLAMLRRILRSHFHEKDATELFNCLSNACQQSNESPQEFVIRLMNLRQKILFVAKESETRVTYNESLVQNRFLQSVITGFRSDNIKYDLKSFFDKPYLSDEDLLEAINKAVSDDNERQTKLHRKSTAPITVSPLGAEAAKEMKSIHAELQKVTAMRDDIEGLKKEFRQLRHDDQSNSNRNDKLRYQQSFRACQRCEDNGVRKCDHCYICGSDNHIMKYCLRTGN